MQKTPTLKAVVFTRQERFDPIMLFRERAELSRVRCNMSRSIEWLSGRGNNVATFRFSFTRVRLDTCITMAQ
jgi:hypothetical protein